MLLDTTGTLEPVIAIPIDAVAWGLQGKTMLTKIVTIAAAIVGFLGLVCIGFVLSVVIRLAIALSPYQYGTYQSPGGYYTVEIYDTPSLGFYSSHPIDIYVIDEKRQPSRQHVVATLISDDGGGASPQNLRVRWTQPEIIQVCLSGEEQDTEIIEINVQSLAYTESSSATPSVPCYRSPDFANAE